MLTASIAFYGFLLLSKMELTLAGAAALGLLWGAAVVFEGPWGSYLVSGLVMAACVALVVSRRRAFREEKR